MRQLSARLTGAPARLEDDFDGKHMTVDVMPLAGSASIVIAATDMSEIYREQAELEGQIRELEALRMGLDEARRNTDAYLETLPDPEKIRRRQELITSTRELAGDVFRRVEENLHTTKANPEYAEAALRENLDLTREGIEAIRSAVTQLRGE